MFLRTRNPGQGVIRLTAKCPPGVCSPNEATFYDEVQVLIFARLKLLNPPDGHFLLPQNGHARIITNRYFNMMYLSAHNKPQTIPISGVHVKSFTLVKIENISVQRELYAMQLLLCNFHLFP